MSNDISSVLGLVDNYFNGELSQAEFMARLDKLARKI